MKTIILRNVFILILCITFLGNTKAQINIQGKIYSTLFEESCVKTINGGYINKLYCILKFDKDSVSVIHEFVHSYSATENEAYYRKEERYRWIRKNKSIIIEDFGVYTLGRSEMVGGKNNNDIRFEEESLLQIEYFTMGGETGSGEKMVITMDSIRYESFDRGETMTKFDTIISFSSWLNLKQTFDIKTYKQLKSEKSNLYFDGIDVSISVKVADIGVILFRNGIEEENVKIKGFTDLLNQQVLQCRERATVTKN